MHLVGTRWEPIARASLEEYVGGRLQGWSLCATSSIVVEVSKGQPLPNSQQPMMWAVLNGTLATYTTIKDEPYLTAYVEEGGIFVGSTPREFAELLGVPAEHPTMTSPLTTTRRRAIAKYDSVVVGTPIGLLSALGRRHPEWLRFAMLVLLKSMTFHMYREYQFLAMNSEERYLSFVHDYPRLAQRLSQREVAQYLGLTPVGLNRVVQRLRQRGAVPYPDSKRRASA